MNDSLNNLVNILSSSGYDKGDSGIFYSSNRGGYWSNLNKGENKAFIETLANHSPREAVLKVIPQYESVIFSPVREAALELLDIRDGHISIDYGCMWGVLSIGLAKRGALVIAIDQTLDSLKFISSRSRSENLKSILCVQGDVREIELTGLADFSIVNGVLEWVPEFDDIELNKYYGKRLVKDYGNINPQELQQKFITRVRKNLKDGGKLLLAIENRFDYTHFLGKPDPHSSLMFTAILPRSISNLISKLRLGRPYVNYIYSFSKTKEMLLKAGFKNVELYMVFPDYRYPMLILPYDGGIEGYKKYWAWQNISWKRRIAYSIEYVLMKFFKGKFFAPSIIAIAEK